VREIAADAHGRVIHSDFCPHPVRQSRAGRTAALRRNGSIIAGIPLDSAAVRYRTVSDD
jgi:hypothetical protein